MPSMNGHGAHEAPRGRSGRRAWSIAAVLAVALLASGVAYLLARGGGDPAPPSPSETPAPSPTGASSPIGTTAPTITSSPTPAAETLGDGRYFVSVESATATPGSLRFDLAEFLTGTDAEEAAQDHGDEVVSGYYIVNDNPRLRRMPVSSTVEVRYIPVSRCCELVPGDWDAFVGAVDGTTQTDYDASAPWWITIRGGTIVSVDQQYLP
ncbi:MAG: hypothetical protein ACXWZF_05480 [Actinomycetota bacterium]